MTPNQQAFLDMIATSEGTINLGDDGYNVVVGGKLFEGYDDHPRIKVLLPKLGISSTAAGRYQVLARYFDVYKKQLGLPDFGHAAQDSIALQLIKECGAMNDVEEGRFATAVTKCRSRWASLPGAGYGQHENSMERLQQAYMNAGGTLA